MISTGPRRFKGYPRNPSEAQRIDCYYANRNVPSGAFFTVTLV
jgi:hypothetical protein